MDDPTPATRLRELDALRGLAALVVVLYHWILFAPGWDAADGGLLDRLRHSPLQLVVAGSEAVLVFFVLSGFVLTVGAARVPNPAAFLVRRVFRLYPAALAALLFAIALVALGGTTRVDGASAAVNLFTAHPLDAGGALAHADLVRGSEAVLRVDSALWSMVHELRISLVFPLLLVTAGLFGAARSALAMGVVSWWAFRQEDGFAGTTMFHTLAYTGCFVAGIALATHRVRLARLASTAPRVVRAAAWTAAVGLLTAPATVGSRWDGFVPGGWSLVLPTLGACLLIVLVQTPGTRRVLHRRAPLFLGRISYSLYLCHIPVRDLLTRTLGDDVPLVLLAPVGIAVAVLLATVAERWIEAPATRAGARVARRLDAAVTRRPARQGAARDAVLAPGR